MARKPTPGETSGALMRDVAELAGVATSTVSRALANPDRVNEKTRRRIAEAAQKLGYTPNAAARNLRVGTSKVVMIVLPGPLHYGLSQVIPLVLAGIDNELMKKGYNLLIANIEREETSEKHILDLAFGGTVAGAIVLSSQPPSSGNRNLMDAGIPVVGLLHDLSPLGLPSVVTNDREVMRQTAEWLIGRGHERFLYISGPLDSYHEPLRLGGIADALAAKGLPEANLTRTDGAIDYEFGFRIGAEAAQAFLQMDPRPDAVMCCSDDAAFSFIAALRSAGLRVPRDVAVVGFDGAEVGQMLDPPLTTIQQPARDLGAKAAEMLLNCLEKTEVPEVAVLESSLMERGSA